MLAINQFLTTMQSPLAVLGTDGGAIATDIYLRKLGLHKNIHCFLDEGQSGKNVFCGKLVMPLQFLAQHPHLTVITASLHFNALYHTIRQMGCSNPFFYHASFWPWLDNEPLLNDLSLIRSCYRQDNVSSAALLETLFDLRFNGDISRIQPYETVKNTLYTQDTYWLEKRMLPDNELTIIDAGAFNGDTMDSLFKTYGTRIKRYYAFEPMPHIFPKLRQTAAKFSETAAITCHNTALYNQNMQMPFAKGVPRSSRMAANGDVLAICHRLDDMGLEIKGQACLKMDIEGAEMSALEGAAGFISQYRPHLAVCLYHKTNDIYRIPQFIKSIVPQYKFVLAGGVHTLCYGSVENF